MSQGQTRRQGWLGAVAIACLVLSAGQWLARLAADRATIAYAPTLLPGFQSDTPTYKRELITFVLFVLIGTGGIAIVWLKELLPKINLTENKWPAILISIVSLIGVALAPFMICKILFILAASAAYFSLNGLSHKISPRIPLTIAFVALAVGSIGFGLRAWYPVQLPNDYYELADSLNIKSGAESIAMPRRMAAACLKERIPSAFADAEQNSAGGGYTANSLSRKRTPEFPSPQCSVISAMSDIDAQQLLSDLASDEIWQGATGRVLYHHSYITVPAIHFLSYGFDSQVQYLYGYGNTIFQSIPLLFFGKSLGVYFKYLPAFEYAGILSIALFVLYITKSARAAFVGLGISLSCYYAIGFQAVQMAASFNSMRYFGLVVQLFSIVFAFRKPGLKSAILIPVALAFSIFWNKEYGLIGCLGQGIALLSPRLAINIASRGLNVVLVALIAIFAVFWNPLSPFILSNTEAGFFNVGLPAMPAIQSLQLFAAMFLLFVVLLGGSISQNGAERDIHLAMIPIIVLSFVKFYFNPSPPHLDFVLIFVGALIVTYFPWEFLDRRLGLLSNIAVLAALGISLLISMRYWESAQQTRLERDAFLMRPWSALADPIVSGAPDQQIADRVKAIEHELRPGDRVMLLSPFDHVLAFYVNPKSYCGHFELLTNAITTMDLKKLRQCATAPGDVLVVYDKTLEASCPVDFDTACPDKQKVKGNLVRLMADLRGRLRLVGENGDLMFYRQQSIPTAPELLKVGATRGQFQTPSAGLLK